MAIDRYSGEAEISAMLGKTITVVDGGVGDEIMTFRCSDGSVFSMAYFQDCCASCVVEDISGDVASLIGSPVVRAEAPSSLDGFDELREAKRAEATDFEYTPESYTWTFYILGTAKGTVTIRWYGSSNGYYSESPGFYRETAEGRA